MKLSRRNFENGVLSFFLFLALFRPRSLSLHNRITSLFNMYLLYVFMLCIFVIIYEIQKKGFKAFSFICYLVLIYKSYELIMVSINGKMDLSTMLSVSTLIEAAFLSDCLIKRDTKSFLSILSLYTGVLLIINNISYFTMGSKDFTDATGNFIYFWSTRNHLSSLMFIAALSSILYVIIANSFMSRIWCMIVIFCFVWSAVMFNSSTTIVGVAVFLLLFIVFRKKKKFFNAHLLFWSGVVANILIVVFRIQYLVSYIVENLLHKNTTFMYRTQIWDLAIYNILKRPLIGYGSSNVFNFSFAREAIPAHNQLLDVAIVCGIPGLILFLLIIYNCFIKLEEKKESLCSRLIVCALFGYMIMMISESPNPYQPWYIIYALSYNVSLLDKGIVYRKFRARGLNRKSVRLKQRNL